MRFLGLICAAVMTVGATGGLAAARSMDAPDYVSSEPAHEAKLDEAPSEVVIRFSEPIDGESTIVVRDECGGRIDDKSIVIFGNEMRVGIAVPREGKHRATFHAVGVGGVTGTRSGTISYTVRNGKPLSCAPPGGHEGHDDGTGSTRHGGRHDRMNHPPGGEHKAGSSEHRGGHSAASGRHDRHQKSAKHAGMAHGKRKHSGGHGKKGDHGSGHDALAEALKKSAAEKAAAAEATTLAAGDGPPAADGSAVLAALGMAMLLGALGGWILRETAPAR